MLYTHDGEGKLADVLRFSPLEIRFNEICQFSSCWCPGRTAVENAPFTDLKPSNMDLRLAYDATIEGGRAPWIYAKGNRRAYPIRDDNYCTYGAPLACAMKDAQARRGAAARYRRMGARSVLLKPGKLTEERVDRKTPVYKKCSSRSNTCATLDILLHHERWMAQLSAGIERRVGPLAARIFRCHHVWTRWSRRPPRCGREKGRCLHPGKCRHAVHLKVVQVSWVIMN